MKRPNIIILNPDEMRWDAMGYMGNPAAVTPNLDAFAQEEAVSFSHAYCQNPVCVPSRCSFFTGLYPHTHGHRTMQYLLHEEESSLFSELKDAGYYVWMNARNDLVAGQIPGLAEKHASEIYYYDKSKPIEPIDISVLKMHLPSPKQENPYDHFGGLSQANQGDKDWEDTIAACQRILNPVDSEKPLCIFLGWNNPHPPYQVEEPYFSMIDRNKLMPRLRYDDTQGKSQMLERLHELVGMENYTEDQWQELRAVYLAQCTKVDDMFRTVCDALKQAGIYDESAIFLLSDHGDFCGDYGLPEKAQNTFEDCLTRVPLLIKPPKGVDIDSGVSDSLVELIDFYATVMDYADVVPNHNHFGRSLREVVADRSKSVRRFVCCEGGRLPGETQCDEWHAEGENGPDRSNAYWPKMTAQLDDAAHEKGTMIFDGRYKYIHRASGQDELYDLEQDPGELVNRYPEFSDSPIVAALRMDMLDWYQLTCDTVPYEYDNRFTEEHLWSFVRRLCPPQMEESVRKYIQKESPSVMQAMHYVIGLLIQGN